MSNYRIDRTSNATTLHSPTMELTFFSRAVASMGWVEAYRATGHIHVTVCLFGWHVHWNMKLAPYFNGPYRGFFHRYLRWANYESR